MTGDVQGASERTPVRAGQILGVGFALLALALAVVMLLQKPLETRDAAQELSAHFAVGSLPFGFQLSEAYELSGTDVVVALTREDPREVPETDEEARVESDEPTAEVAEEESADVEGDEEWTVADHERHAQEDDTPPSLVYLVRYPADDVKSVLAKHFERQTSDWGHGGEGPTKLSIDGGRLRWGDFDADFVLERKYEDDGHFTDVVRVNLTHGEACWILFAVWPQDYRASREPVESLLASLPPAPGRS